MTEIKGTFKNKKEKLAYIAECEASFERRLDEVSADIVRDHTKIIALSGPTCSGKTTTAKKLTADLTAAGCDVYLVSIDNFFHSRDQLDKAAAESGKPLDYDSVNAIDLELLAERAASILRGDPTELPVFDFPTGRRTHYETVDAGENSVFIFEGIQAIYPEVTALLGDGFRSVFICVEDDLTFEEKFFGKRELRLMRRLVRDYHFRGASPDFTFQLWRSVTLNEDRSIFPYVDSVDVKINSTMPYELCLWKHMLPPILKEVNDPMYLVKALELSRKLDAIEEIPPEMIPAHSLMREFVGKMGI